MLQVFPLRALSALIACALVPSLGQAMDLTGHSLELKSRVVQFDVDQLTSGTTNPDFKQSALGMQLEYKSPYFNDFIGAEISGYQVNKLGESGASKNELLPFEAGSSTKVASSWNAIGKAFIKIKHGDLVEARIGRQSQNSLLLKSTYSRAVEDTFNGVSITLKPAAGLKLYGSIYDSWMPRNGDKFVKLGTEQSPSSGQVTQVIDNVTIFGGQYVNGPYQLDIESLNSKNYLRKYAAVGSYAMPLQNKDQLKFSVGASTSSNAGSLFNCDAEKELDKVTGQSCSNNGRGIYLSTEWKTGSFTLTGAVAKFNGLWIEDNFAASNPAKAGSLIQDHGTNFFPTGATSGNDMTNDGELARMVRLSYNWNAMVPGLNTAIGYKLGTGARNNVNPTLGSGKENETELDVRYAVPFLKGLSTRYNYLKYNADVTDKLNAITAGGSKTFRRDHRIYLDYTYKFF